MDYQAILYNPTYSAIGVSAVLTPASGSPVNITVIDKTSGVEVFGQGHGSKNMLGFGVDTVHPGATLRMVELVTVGLSRADLDMSAITFNGRTWRIKSHALKPSPNGLDDGEAMLFLTESA